MVLAADAPSALAGELGPRACAAPILDRLLAQAQVELERDQRQAYAAIHRAPPVYSADSLARAEREADQQLFAALSTFPGTTPADVERLRASLIEQRRKLASMMAPSAYEDLLSYRYLRVAVNQMSQGVDEYQSSHPGVPRALPDLRQVLLGTLPYRSIGASETVFNPGAEKGCRVYRVVLNAGLMRFASVFSGILVRSLAPAAPLGRFLGTDMNPDAVAKHLDAHPEIVADFEALMRTYLLRGVPDFGVEIAGNRLAEPYATIAAMLERAMTVYAVGHEFGHVMYDQQDLQEAPGLGLPAGWSQEYFADGWGMTLSLMAKGRNHDAALAVQGAALYFICYELLERGISLIATGQDTRRAKTSHPPANYRKERIPSYLLVSLRDYFNQKSASTADLEPLLLGYRRIDAVADELWSRAKPGLRRLFLQRARLAPEWEALIPAVQ